MEVERLAKYSPGGFGVSLVGASLVQHADSIALAGSHYSYILAPVGGYC
jgi:hypothetical protein